MSNCPLPILYSFRRCPYAIRARWSLLHAGQLVQLREIELKAKPPQMLEVSPKGTVPVLVLADGSVIDESIDIMHWALKQADPFDLLCKGDGSAQQEMTLLIDEQTATFKYHLDRFKYIDRYPGDSKDIHHQAGREILYRWNERIAVNGWLIGERMSLADQALWPFVRQWRIADPKSFDADPGLSAMQHWLRRFLEDQSFERLMARFSPWHPDQPESLFPADSSAVPLDQPLFHLALSQDWQAAQDSGSYQVSTRGLTLSQVGFIHLSWLDQVKATFDRFYADAADVLLLTIDPACLTNPLRAEVAANGELFPHLFGPLPVKAVMDARPYSQ